MSGCAVPLADVTGVTLRTAVQSSASTLCHNHDGPILTVHTFKRRNFDWVPVEHALEFAEEAAAEFWQECIQSVLDRLPDRPDRLFVVINPYGGTQRADIAWRDVVKPIFERAHITCDAFRTGFRDHAVELLEQMPWEQFNSYDGIVAIGGDGLFQECLRGVLALRARGGEWRAKAKNIRIAQLPAGSTDAVACTVNGCRSAVTAALHVVLGDRAQLDVLEVRTGSGQCRYACSAAAYGFVGDVLGKSEGMRWMGPARYDVGGALALMRLQSYPVRLRYKTPAAPHPMRRVCCSHCTICSAPASHTFDGDAPLNIVERSVSGIDDDAASAAASGIADGDAFAATESTAGAVPISQAQAAAQHRPPAKPPRKAMHMRCASGFTEPSTSGSADAAAQPAVAHRPSPLAAAQPSCSSASALPSRQPSACMSMATPTERADSGAAAMPDLGLGDDGGTGSSSDGSSNDSSRWRCWSGEISSLMVVVTPTRSDKAKGGIVPHAHLSDGRLHLIIVRKCSRAQFLRFLMSLSRGGVDERFDFVEVKEVEAWRLEELCPQGRGSVWNVDGELMQTKFMSARCHHGLMQVFGRGPEYFDAPGSKSGSASGAAPA